MGTQGENKKTGNVEKQLTVYVIVIFIAAFLIYYGAEKMLSKPKTPNTQSTTASTQIQYEHIDLQTMLDELNTNALRAEETYQDKYIEITGEIRNFDSDGKYISIIPCGSPLLSESTMCYLTDPAHKSFLLEKNKGDVVTIKGKVTSIGEVIGYHIDIAEISD